MPPVGDLTTPYMPEAGAIPSRTQHRLRPEGNYMTGIDQTRALDHYSGLREQLAAENAQQAALRVVQPLIDEIAAAADDEVAEYQARVRSLAAELRELRGAS